jgi:uncharacterized membrane protein
MKALYVTSIVVHILAVAIWLGGGAFLGIVLAPVLRRPENRAIAAGLFERTAMRFRLVSWVCLALVVVTGVLSLALRGVGMTEVLQGEFWGSPFGVALAHKLALVLFILVLTVVHDSIIGPRALQQWREDPDSPQTTRLRKLSGRIGRVNLVLAIATIVVAVVLARGAI